LVPMKTEKTEDTTEMNVVILIILDVTEDVITKINTMVGFTHHFLSTNPQK